MTKRLTFALFALSLALTSAAAQPLAFGGSSTTTLDATVFTARGDPAELDALAGWCAQLMTTRWEDLPPEAFDAARYRELAAASVADWPGRPLSLRRPGLDPGPRGGCRAVPDQVRDAGARGKVVQGFTIPP